MLNSIEIARYFEMVVDLARNSPDPRTQVGAILLDANDELIAQGYNHPLKGCADYESLNLPKNLVMRHAERTAIFEGVCKYGVQGTRGASLITNSIPCANCAYACIEYGIRRIYILKSYDSLIPSDKLEYFQQCEKLLTSAGVNIYRVDCELNKQILFDSELINV